MTNRYEKLKAKKELGKKLRARNSSFLRKKSNEKPKANWSDFKLKDDKLLLCTKGIVAKVIRDKIKVLVNNEIINCKLPIEMPKTLVSNLVIGDKVFINKENEVVSRSDRKTHLSRLRSEGATYSNKHIIAVNIDYAVIVATVAEPEFNAGLIDRYLILCQNGNIKPIICLNKIDLSDKRHPILKLYKEKLGIDVIEVSVKENIGFDKLREKIQHKTIVLVGNSGVGKSSITNKLLKSDDIKTQFVSEKGQQGKHTTTSSDLYILNKDTYIIDTPGVRSLSLIGIDKQDLQFYFDDFVEFKTSCEYRDCLHSTEPDCAVRRAVESGEISKLRYESYLRILESIS